MFKFWNIWAGCERGTCVRRVSRRCRCRYWWGTCCTDVVWRFVALICGAGIFWRIRSLTRGASCVLAGWRLIRRVRCVVKANASDTLFRRNYVTVFVYIIFFWQWFRWNWICWIESTRLSCRMTRGKKHWLLFGWWLFTDIWGMCPTWRDFRLNNLRLARRES